MEAGKLRRPVTIQQQSTASKTTMGFLTNAWTDVLSTWAAVTVRTMTSLVTVGTSQEPVTKNTYILTIRYAPSTPILAGMRVKDGSNYFLIQSVGDKDERHRELTLFCSQIPAPSAEEQ